MEQSIEEVVGKQSDEEQQKVVRKSLNNFIASLMQMGIGAENIKKVLQSDISIMVIPDDDKPVELSSIGIDPMDR